MNPRRFAARCWHAARGRIAFAWVEKRLPTRFFGSDYGGWEVYTKPLTPDSIVYSFGIGHDHSFDIALIEAVGCNVYAYDPTPGLVEHFAATEKNPKFIFRPVGLDASDREVEIRPLFGDRDCSQTIVGRDQAAADTHGDVVSVRRITTLMAENGHTRIDLLKMDIEGSEFDVIPDLIASGIQIDQIAVEFHPSWKGGVERSRQCIAMLKRAGYRIFSISARHIEYGFVHERLLG